MGIVIETGGLRGATSSEYPQQSEILRGHAFRPTKAGVDVQAGSAGRDGSAAPTSDARKRNHYARAGQASFDERSHKLVTLAVESFGRLGKEGGEPIDQLAASVWEERTGVLHLGRCFVLRSAVSRL